MRSKSDCWVLDAWVKIFNFNLWELVPWSSALAWLCFCVSLPSMHRHSPFRQHKTKDKHEIDRMTLTMVSPLFKMHFFFLLEIEAKVAPGLWIIAWTRPLNSWVRLLIPSEHKLFYILARARLYVNKQGSNLCLFLSLNLQIRMALLRWAAKHFSSLAWNPASTLKSLKSVMLWVHDQYRGSR